MTEKLRICEFLRSRAEKYKGVFAFSTLIGLLAYMYAFTNKLPNHDDGSDHYKSLSICLFRAV